MPNSSVYRAPHPPPGAAYNENVWGTFAPPAKPAKPAADRFVDITNLIGRAVGNIDTWLEHVFAPRPRIIGAWLRESGVAVQRGDAVDLATHAFWVGLISGVAAGVVCATTTMPEATAVILAVTCMMFYHAIAVDGCFNP